MARCTRCGKQVEDAKYKRCQYCREVANERKFWKVHGKCTRCGKQVMEPGQKQCPRCREYWRGIQRAAAKQNQIVIIKETKREKSDCKCDYCSKATPVLCRWIGGNDRTGIVLRERKVEDKSLSRPYTVYRVVECDRFDGSNNGKLPAITGDGRVPGNQEWPPNVVQGV